MKWMARIETNIGDRRTMDGKGYPPFRTCRGQTTILEEAEVAYNETDELNRWMLDGDSMFDRAKFYA
jgi:hypothetical protein